MQRKKDGSRVIWGKATDGMLDLDEQIVDPEWAAEKLTQWFADLEDGGFNATIHQMHSPLLAPAGKGKSLTLDGDEAWVRAKIVEPTAVTLLDEGVYRGLSIGILDPPIFPDPKARGGRIGRKGAGGYVNEVSLVDTPANPRCLLSLAKRASATAPIEPTGTLALVDGDDVVPLASATRSQVTKAWVRAGADQAPDAITRALMGRLAELSGRVGKKAKRKGVPVATETKHAIPEGMIECPTCHGEGAVDDGKCAKCKGKGYYAPEPARRGKARDGVAVGKSMARSAIRIARALTKNGSADEDVEAAVDDLMDAVRDAAEAQAEDEAQDPGKPTDAAVTAGIQDVAGAVAELAGAQAADSAADEMGKRAKKGKRDVDPNVGGGVDRDKLDASDFVFPATRDFPVVTPGDVSDAVSSWGRYKGPESFESFKSKLIALAHRKGDAFVKELPASWTKDGEKRKGKKVAKAAIDKGAAVPEQDGKLVPGEGAVDAQAGTQHVPSEIDPGPKKGKKAKKGKRATKAAKEDKKPPLDGEAEDEGKRRGKKLGKVVPVPELRVHDLLCPSYSTKAVKGLYPLEGKGAIPDVVSPDYFAARLAELSSSRRKAAKGSLAEAYQDFAAAAKLATLEAPTFVQMRDAAHKSFMDAYPDVQVKPGLIDPEALRRPYLPGATPETSGTTRVPMPDVHAQLRPEQFRRPPLTVNETRPTLSGGESVARKGKKGKRAAAATKRTRDFYTNAAKDEHASAMALLHDHIVSRYPGICPMEAVAPGTAIDRDGLAGSPAEMHALGPDVGRVPSPAGAGGGTLSPVGKTGKKAKGKARSTKGAAEAPDLGAIEALVESRLGKVRAKSDRKIQKLEKRLAKREGQLKELLRRPDPTQRAHRGTSLKQFRPRSSEPEVDLDHRQIQERVRVLKGRLHDPNSSVAMRAQEELQRIFVDSPRDFARLATSDDDGDS